MKKVIASTLLLASVVFFPGCGSDDDKNSASLTVILDGETLSLPFSSAVLVTDGDARTLNISAIKSESNLLSLAVSDWAFNSLPENGIVVKKYFTDIESVPETGQCETVEDETYCPVALITYSDPTGLYSSGFVEGGDGYIEITKCDNSAKKISGKFKAGITTDPEVDPVIIEGTFENLPYILGN